jgi:hypothetical protein
MKRAYDLSADYGVSHDNGDKTLSGAGLSLPQAQDKFKALRGWLQFAGWDESRLLTFKMCEAAFHDATWAGMQGQAFSKRPDHGIGVQVPSGRFGTTYPIPVAQGEYEGAGPGWTVAAPHDFGSTEFYVDHANWKADKSPDRICIRTANWGVDDGSDAAWCHHISIKGFRFSGQRRTGWVPKNTLENAGIGLWDAGENSKIERCFFSGFEKDGALCVRGTPVAFEDCSFFNNSRFGIAIIGGGTVTAVNVSGDENWALIGGGPGYGRPGSASLRVFGFKHETGTSGPFRPFKGMALVDFEGWLTAVVHGASFAGGHVHPWCVFRVKPVTNRSSITATGLHFFGNLPPVMIYDEENDIEFRTKGDAWFGANSEVLWAQYQHAKNWWTHYEAVPAKQKGRLQFVNAAEGGATSFETAKVLTMHGDVLDVPVTGTPVTPTPTDPVPTDPPPTGTGAVDFTKLEWKHSPAILSPSKIEAGAITYAAAKVNWNIKKLTFTITPKDLEEWRCLLSDASGKKLQIRKDGSMVDTATGQVLIGPGKLKIGVKSTHTITLTTARVFTDLLAQPNGTSYHGNAFQGAFENVIINP